MKETNIAVEENRDRLDEVNSTLLYLEISYEDPASPSGIARKTSLTTHSANFTKNYFIDAQLEPDITRPPLYEDGIEEPTLIPVDYEIS